jgi:hypothetical protein
MPSPQQMPPPCSGDCRAAAWADTRHTPRCRPRISAGPDEINTDAARAGDSIYTIASQADRVRQAMAESSSATAIPAQADTDPLHRTARTLRAAAARLRLG